MTYTLKKIPSQNVIFEHTCGYAALRTMVHEGVRCPSEVGVACDIFHFLVVHKEHAKNGHLLSVFGGAQARTYINIVFLCLTMNAQIKVDNVGLYRRTLW